MGLFDKKFCSVCGEKIKFLGNRKLEDGNLCKDCASKLSYWFDDRRHSTVAEIQAQLAYREENLAKVQAFNTTNSIGRGPIVAIDENKKQFMVVRTGNALEENPDVIDISDLTGVDIDIDEDRDEEKRELEDGREISYSPPHYSWSYNFKITIRVNNPYFDDMSFKLNTFSIEVRPANYSTAMYGFDPRKDAEYLEYANLAQEIKDALLGLRNAAKEDAAPKAPVVCPHCGATTVPDAGGCCEYCGAPV